MNTEAYRQSARQRKKIETRFGDVKRNLGFTRLRLRGLTGARDEFLLAATVQNLKTSGQPRPDAATQIHGRLIDAPNPKPQENQSATATAEGGIEKSAPIKRGHHNRPKTEFFNSLRHIRTSLHKLGFQPLPVAAWPLRLRHALGTSVSAPLFSINCVDAVASFCTSATYYFMISRPLVAMLEALGGDRRSVQKPQKRSLSGVGNAHPPSPILIDRPRTLQNLGQ